MKKNLPLCNAIQLKNSNNGQVFFFCFFFPPQLDRDDWLFNLFLTDLEQLNFNSQILYFFVLPLSSPNVI